MEPTPAIPTGRPLAGRLAIALVTETYPPEINGVANTLRHLADGLDARGHHVQLIRPRQRTDLPEPNLVSRGQHLVPGLPLPGYRGLRFGLPVYWRLRRIWAGVRPDLIYIATQGPLGHAALYAAGALNIPAVTGFHTQFDQYSRHYRLGLLSRPIAAALRRFHNRSDMTLVATAEMQAEMTAAGFRHVRVFSRGVDVGRFSPARREPTLRRSWGCDQDTLVVLYVGRIAPEKNLTLARDAFWAIRAERPDARFVLVGDGPALKRLRRECPDFLYAGPQVGPALSAHYAAGDLLLFPSSTETFGNVVIEAMASGLPVIAFDYAAARVHIASQENGITVPLGDERAFVGAAREAAHDLGRLRQLGQAARKAAETIPWDGVLGKFEAHLEEVLRRRRSEAVDPRGAGAH